MALPPNTQDFGMPLKSNPGASSDLLDKKFGTYKEREIKPANNTNPAEQYNPKPFVFTGDGK